MRRGNESKSRSEKLKKSRDQREKNKREGNRRNLRSGLTEGRVVSFIKNMMLRRVHRVLLE